MLYTLFGLLRKKQVTANVMHLRAVFLNMCECLPMAMTIFKVLHKFRKLVFGRKTVFSSM